ncbi:hypothetical protein ACCT14_02865 [Rhizobium brockwellii]
MKADRIGPATGKSVHGRRLALAAETLAVFDQVAASDKSLDYRRNSWWRQMCEPRDLRLRRLAETPHGIQNNALVVMTELDGIAAFSCHPIPPLKTHSQKHFALSLCRCAHLARPLNERNSLRRKQKVSPQIIIKTRLDDIQALL